MKNFILFILFMAVAAGVPTACGGGKKRAESGENNATTTGAHGSWKSVIDISDSLINHRRSDTINFGRVREGETIVREFRIRNADDNKAMVITRIDLSCGCLAVDYPRQPLRPDEEGKMQVSLDTRGLGGWIFKTAIMQTSLAARPYVFYITAEIE